MRLGLASLLVTLLLCLSRAESVLPPPDWSPVTTQPSYHTNRLTFFPYSNGKSAKQLHTYLNPTLSDSFQTGNQFGDEDSHFIDESHEIRENLTVGDLKKEPMADKVKLVLGYLTAVKGDLKERQGLAISGAISMAVEEVSLEGAWICAFSSLRVFC